MATALNGAGSPLPFIHPDDMPDVYALRGVGTCMEPRVPDGSLVVMDKRQTPAPGDVVSVTFTREAAARWRLPGLLKMLALGLPPMNLVGDAVGLIVVDQINPPRRYAIPTTDVLAVHKCLGTAETGSDGTVRFDTRKGGF